jgi:hypothetical protein
MEKTKKVQLSFMLNPKVKDNFLLLCDEKMLNKSIVIERLIEQYMNSNKKTT